MLIFGFDPSLTDFGWVLHDTEGVGRSRCIARGRFQTSAKQEEVDRHTFLRDSVVDLLMEYPHVTRVALETPYTGDTYSEGLYALFVQVQQAVKGAGRDAVFLTPSHIKAWGKRFLERPKWWKMMKTDSVEAARLDTDGGRWNHNEADAYLVALMGSRFWQAFDGVIAPEELSEYERHAFLREHKKRSGKIERTGLIFKEGKRFHLWSQPTREKNGN
jgi:hypothetical protein